MACEIDQRPVDINKTKKRPHDWECHLPLQSSPSTQATTTGITPTAGTSGFAGFLSSPTTSHGLHGHHIHLAARKRIRTSMEQEERSPSLPPKNPSAFADAVPKMSTDVIVNAIKEEVRRLHNRRQLPVASQLKSPELQGFGSAHSSRQGSDDSLPGSDNAISSTTSQLLANYGLGLTSPSLRDQPLFTFRQVGLICERLLKEREQDIRQEYDKILAAKLAEQYDAFVKFTYDHVQRRFERESIPSYLS